MTGSEARKLKGEELNVELATLRNRLFDLRTQAVTDKVANTCEPRNVRRDIARLLTERTARHAAKNGKAPAPASASGSASGSAPEAKRGRSKAGVGGPSAPKSGKGAKPAKGVGATKAPTRTARVKATAPAKTPRAKKAAGLKVRAAKKASTKKG